MSINFSLKPAAISEIFAKLKTIYSAENNSACEEIADLVKENGYLPYSHIKALKTLTPAQVIAGIEAKFEYNKVLNNGKFNFETLSPIARKGYRDSSWIQKEQTAVKLINLAALGDGNKTKDTATFINILTQILILPPCTTMYILPFYPREFGCAYLPKSSEVTNVLCDKIINKNFGFDAKQQVQLILAFAQLAGHATMYDVLPQTARYSKAVLAKPEIARWFDIGELIEKIKLEIEKLDCADKIIELLKEHLVGNHIEIDRKLKMDYENASEKLIEKKKEFSDEMMKRENQTLLHKKVKEIVTCILDVEFSKELTEEDITKQDEIISTLIEKGLWPAPGGAWCSCGVPVFDEMCPHATYPLFKHFNVDGIDVTKFANLNCQTPYYFFNFDTKTYNEDVIEFYINSLKKLQKDYNFDGFRVDHIDHIVDRVSEQDGLPISYRAPRIVLSRANSEMKKIIPYFATLAEYMLWDGFLKEYHQDMHFDLLWGNDIISQSEKSLPKMFDDLKMLEEYNRNLPEGIQKLSILKTYNNQDGEFLEIDQYPGQLGENGALFKWFKYRTIVSAPFAARPMLYVDGDESFTKEGTEFTIGNETSMKREDNEEFFQKFKAIAKFTSTCKFCLEGKSELLRYDEDGFAVWKNSKEDREDALLVVANSQYETEKKRSYDENGNLVINNLTGEELSNKTFELDGFYVESEFVYKNGEFIETKLDKSNKIEYKTIKPSEFHLYRIRKA